jgi:hypothetical protein
MKLKAVPDGPDGQIAHKQPLRDQEREHNKAYDVKPLHHQADWHHDKQNHQIAEKGAGWLVLAPPIVSFEGIYFHTRISTCVPLPQNAFRSWIPVI